MPKIIRNLQASCNLLNPRQKRLYDFVIEQAGPNVSDWMKGLIEREMVRLEMAVHHDSQGYAGTYPKQAVPDRQTFTDNIVKAFI